MNTLNKRSVSFALALVFAAMMVVPAVGSAAVPTVNQGVARSFAVLAGETITNTGPTTIGGSAGGDVGLHPGTEFPGQSDVTLTNGAFHLADDVALQAKNALVQAYDDAAGATPVTRISSELGGTTLKPGVYDSADGTFQITGALTLDGDGVYIFQTSTTLVTASDSSVALINGAQPCKVFWKVGSSATLGTGSDFVGHVFALTSIEAHTGATIRGQLLARNGSVTLDNNTITNDLCRAVSNTPATPGGSTTSGGELPKTATPLYEVLLLGVALILIGAAVWSGRKRLE